MPKKCIVKDCTNYNDSTEFEGEICKPCFDMLVYGDHKEESNNFIHRLSKEVMSYRESKGKTPNCYVCKWRCGSVLVKCKAQGYIKTKYVYGSPFCEGVYIKKEGK